MADKYNKYHDWTDPIIVALPLVGGATESGQYLTTEALGNPTSGTKQDYITHFDDTQAMRFAGLLADPEQIASFRGTPYVNAADLDGANVVAGLQPKFVRVALRAGEVARWSQVGDEVYMVDEFTCTLNKASTTNGNRLGWLRMPYDASFPTSSPISMYTLGGVGNVTGNYVWVEPDYTGAIPAATENKVTFSTQPATAVAGATMASVAVTVRTSGNALVAGALVTLSIAPGGQANLVGTVQATTNAYGVASFGTLSVTVPGTYTLSAAVQGSQTAVSTAFVITAS